VWFMGGPSSTNQQKFPSLLADWNAYVASKSEDADLEAVVPESFAPLIRTANDTIMGTFNIPAPPRKIPTSSTRRGLDTTLLPKQSSPIRTGAVLKQETQIKLGFPQCGEGQEKMMVRRDRKKPTINRHSNIWERRAFPHHVAACSETTAGFPLFVNTIISSSLCLHAHDSDFVF
jgi:hypothetical protein